MSIKKGGSAYMLFIVVSLLLQGVDNTYAHPGNTDSSGCHTCRTNCPSWGLDTGEYHCHRAKAIPQPEEPIKSTYGANGTGYISPAPEYKNPTPTTETKTSPALIEPAKTAEEPEDNKESGSETLENNAKDNNKEVTEERKLETENKPEGKNENVSTIVASIDNNGSNQNDSDALKGFLALGAIGGGIWYWRNKKEKEKEKEKIIKLES